jgi:DNA-binding transcriptional regulator YiaG
MNVQMLKGLIVANDKNQETLAKAMGLSLSRFNAKLHEQGGAEFSKSEIEFIRNRYKLSRKQVMDIFFTDVVS